MATSSAYGIGKFIGKYWGYVLAGVLGLYALVLIERGGHQMEDNYAKLEASKKNSVDPKSECLAKRAQNVSAAASAATEGKFSLAHGTVSRCAVLTDDTELTDLASKYYFLERKRVLLAQDSTPSEKVAAGNDITSQYSQEAKALSPPIKAANEALKREQRAQELEIAKEKQAIARRKRSEGVNIGMTKEDVLASSWGKPKSVNRTVAAWGVSEQWVYDGGYLYFKDGILETIQN